MSKKDTQFLKGISILLLVIHHNWYSDDVLYPIQSGLRIVVWIFLFITAYGLSIQLEASGNKHPIKFILRRLALVYVPFWICCMVNLISLLLVDPGRVTGFFSSSPIIWILDIFSLSHLFGTPALIGGWYISMLVLLLITFPLVHFIVSKTKWFSVLLLLVIVWFFKWKILFEYGGYLDQYLLIVVLGILFCKYNCFKYLPKINGMWRILLIALSVIIVGAALCIRYSCLKGHLPEIRSGINTYRSGHNHCSIYPSPRR